MAIIKIAPLRPTKAPNLIVARQEYDMQQQELFKAQLRTYFSQLDNFTQAASIPLSGPTANRPVSDNVQVPLAIGQTYFDTTLGIPIWWDGADWINASGTTV
jgi:hypothetical protein